MRVDIDALIDGGVKAFLCAAYAIERTMFNDVWPLRIAAAIHPRGKRISQAPMDSLVRECLDHAEKMVAQTRKHRGNVIEVARSFSDMTRIMNEGKVCLLHSVEGAHHLNGDIDMLDELFERGVCHVVLPHLYPNEAGGCVNIFEKYKGRPTFGCFLKKHQDATGLSPWGKELVEKLLHLGILVDPTHGTREFRRQVLDIAKNHPKHRPVVMSHACLPSPSEEGMGPLPNEIRAIADLGGVVGIMMYTHRESGQQAKNGIQYVMRSIEHLIQHGGEDVVAIGSDFDGSPDTPSDLRSPRAYKTLREELQKIYSEPQVIKFLSSNALRAIKAGWGKA
jgi:membrane dipeptidase